MEGRLAKSFFVPSWTRFYAVCHHILLAMTIASVTVLVGQTREFAPFDLTTRSLMTYFQAWKDVRLREETLSRGFQVAWNPNAAGDRPLVIMFTQFPAQAAAAGLQPAEFAAYLIAAAVQQGPAILAVNLDSLDPYWDDPRLNDPACDALLTSGFETSPVSTIPEPCRSPRGDAASSIKSMHKAIAARATLKQALSEAAKRAPVVIKTARLPLSVEVFNDIRYSNDPVSQRVAMRRLAWTFDLCQIPNLRIAYDLTPRGAGVAFDRGIPSMGNVVYEVHRLISSKPRQPGFQYAIQKDIDPAMDGCAPFRGSPSTQLIGSFSNPNDAELEASAFFHKLAGMTAPSGLGSIGTISSRYHETLFHGIFADIRNLRPGERIGDVIPRGLHNKVVFLGDDTLRANLLQFKDQPEVDFHAAVFYSNVHSVIGPTHVFAFALDVALGSLLGLLFAWSWGLYGRARMAMDRLSAKSLREMFAKAPGYCRARGVLVFNLALLACLTWIVFALANFFLRKDVWINPLPLVVGISLKGLLASRQVASEREAHDWWTFYNQHPDVILQVPIIVISIAVVLYLGQ